MRPTLSGRALAGLAFLLLAPSAFAALRLEATLRPRTALPADPALADARQAEPILLRLDRGATAPAHDIPSEGPLQPLIAVVRVNEQDKGEHVVYLRGTNDFLLARNEVAAWIKVPDNVPSRTIDGVECIELGSLPGTRWRFDDERLELRVTLPPQDLPVQRFAYDSGTRAPLTPSAGPSALFNYRLGWFSPGGAADTISSLATETKIHWGSWLFSNQAYTTHGGSDAGTTRGLTSLVRDDPARLARLTFGDAYTRAEDLAGGTIIGGVTYAKAYELDPYLIRQPTASFRTLVETPSTVDVYAGNNRIYRQAVAPGPVEVGNLSYLLGQRDLRVVVRDAFGRERQLDLPFYFAARALAPGLEDFSYSVGAIRENLAAPGQQYGRAAFSAMHRFGVNDTLTLGGRVEGMGDFVTAGPSMVLRSDRLGELSLALLATRAKGMSGTPGAVAAAYSFLSGGLGVFLASRRTAAGFRIVQVEGTLGPARADDAASFSYSRERWGTVSVFGHRAIAHDGVRTRDVGAGYSIPLRRDLTLQANYRRTQGVIDTREVFIGLQYIPLANWTALASARDERGARTYSLQAGNLLPEGEGVGYRVTAESSDAGGQRQQRLEPDVTVQGRYATLDARVSAVRGDGASGTSHSGGVSGAVALVGGHVGLSRPVDDSFALVRIEPPIADVRVTLNQQEIGRTGPSGELFIPRVIAYVENHVGIDDRDVPIDRALDQKSRLLVPSAGRGDIVTFQAPSVRGISGVLRSRRGGVEAPIELTVFVLDTPGGQVEVPVGRGGDFYVENLAAGRYRARIELSGQPCRFAVTIPDSHEPFIRLDPIVACTQP